MTEGNGAIKVPIKEWLQRIDSKLDSIDLKLEMKADRESVHSLTNRIAAFEIQEPLRQQLVLEFRDSQTRIRRLESWRNRLAGGYTVVLLIASFALYRLWGG